MSVQVSTRIDKATKQEFDKVCESIGLSASSTISMLIKAVINYNGIPFSVIAPAADAQKNKMSRAEMFGCMRGHFKMSEDFDEPLEDFKEYM